MTRSDSEQTVTIPGAGEYRVDPGACAVAFTTRHLFGLAPVRGTFDVREGHLHVAEQPERTAVRVTIAAPSFATGNTSRDAMVRSATYLDADRHPDITFRATAAERTAGGWVAPGQLTVRDVTRDLAVQVDAASVNGRDVTLRAHARVDRYAFGITAMKGMTGRYLDITLDVTARRQ